MKKVWVTYFVNVPTELWNLHVRNPYTEHATQEADKKRYDCVLKFSNQCINYSSFK
jgi:hypothetical protein